MCSQSDDPSQYDPPITQRQRDALTLLHNIDTIESRLRRRVRNLEALGFSEAEAYRLARTSWRVQRGDNAA